MIDISAPECRPPVRATTLWLRAGLLLAALLVLPALAAAQTPGGDVINCGGRDEPACDLFTRFFIEQLAFCDRGLVLSDFTCVNEKRRQGPGTAFRDSWLGRLLRFQQDDLHPDTPINRRTMIGIHNAFNNDVDGYQPLYQNQRYSITELLDAGFRQMELDVYSFPGSYLKLCHGVCNPSDRWFANGLKEIRDWLKEPGHSQEILVIDIEHGLAAADADLFDGAIKGYLADEPGIGVLTQDEFSDFHPSNKLHRTMLDADVDNLVWPSRSWMLANNRRVVFIMRDLKGKYGIRARTTIEIQKVNYSTCKDPFSPIATRTVYSDELPEGADPLTKFRVEGLLKCNAAIITADQLLNDDRVGVDHERMEGAAWSWAAGQPAQTGMAGKAALMNAAGRWEARDRTERHRFLCGAGTFWRISSADGEWGEGREACEASFSSLAFGVPTRLNENVAARDIQSVSGLPEVWLHLVPAGDGDQDRWLSPPPLSVTIRPVLAVTTSSTPSFLLSWSGSPSFTSVEWNFGDGGVSSDYPGSHRFSTAGTYTVTARIVDDFSRSATATREVTVHEPDDPTLGELTIGGPGLVSAGSTAVFEIGHAGSWILRLDTVTCGSPATHAVRESLALITATGGRYRWELKCRYSTDIALTDATRVNQLISASVARVDDLCINGCSTLLNATFPVTVLVPPTVSILGQTVAGLGLRRFPIFKVDPDGGTTQIVSAWCGPAGVLVSPLTAESTFIDCNFNLPIVSNLVTVSVVDDDSTTRDASLIVRVTADGAPPVLDFSGPFNFTTTSSAGAVVAYGATALDNVDGGVPLYCQPFSGQTFPIGTTTVSCFARDSSNNFTEGSFDVVVRDVTPVVAVPRFANPDYHWPLGGGYDARNFGIGIPLAHGRRNVAITEIDRTACRADQRALLFPGGEKVVRHVTEVDITSPLVDLQSAGQLSQLDFTAALWFKTTASGPLLSNRVYPPEFSEYKFFELLLNADGSVTGNVGGYGVVGGANLADGQWHHVALRRAGTRVDLFVDGTPAAHVFTSAGLRDVSSGGPLFLGGRRQVSSQASLIFTPNSTETEFFAGAIDEVFLFKRAIDNGELASIYRSLADADDNGTCDEQPIDIESQDEAGPDGAFVNWQAYTRLGDFERRPAECRLASGEVFESDMFPAGITTVSCNDPLSEDELTVSFTVRVRAQAAPTLIVPGTMYVAATSAAGAVVTYQVIASDAQDESVDLVCVPESHSQFPVGQNRVECRATDSDGNVTISSFSVWVDDEPPFIVPHDNVVAEAASSAGAVVTFAPATASDHVSAVVITYSQASGTLFGLGDTTVTVTAKDAAGNASTRTFTVTVSDGTPPAITASNAQAEATSAAGAIVSFAAATATDAVSTPMITYSQNPGTLFALGDTPVTVTATDAAGNASTATLTVTVSDTTAPAITANNAQAEATSGAGAIVSFAAATATDAVSSPVITYSQNPGTLFALGDTPVTVTATDAEGNVSTATFTVTVSDTTAPAITASDAQAEASSAAGAIVSFAAVTAIDAVSTPVITYSQESGTLFPLGATTVTVMATDAAGNSAETTFVVEVGDTMAPAITAANVQAEAASAAGAIVSFAAATATDAVSTPVITYSQNPGTLFALGETPVTVTATDAKGNVSTATFTVTVSDTTAPGISASDAQAEATSAAGAIVSFAAATATDAVSAVVITYSQNPGTLFALGDTAVTATATDEAGNVSTSTFTVTVSDTTRPAITADNAQAEATSGAGAIVSFAAATATDAVSTPVITYSQNPGTLFALGDTAVTVTATDEAGNASTATFTVIVLDTTAPAITASNAQAEATSAAGAIVSFASATATDAVSTPVITYSQNPGTLFPLGATTVTATATDAAGNSASTTFTVTVLGPLQLVANLKALAAAAGMSQGDNNLDNVIKHLTKANGNTLTPACNNLDAFIKKAGKLPPPHRQAVIDAAQRLRIVIGC